MKNWLEQGCNHCRKLWESGSRPALINVSSKNHTRLYRCSICNSFWEENERFSCIITDAEAKNNYPDTK